MLEGRDWFRVAGATPEELLRLQVIAPDGLPSRYLELLAFSNGGEGPLVVQPYNICLDPIITVLETIERGRDFQPDLDGFLIFGGDGGGEYIAFDVRHGAPWPIVKIDMVAGSSSAEVIATDFEAFYERIGREEEAT